MMCLFTAAPFFLDLATFTIVWFLQYESYFFGFGLLGVFSFKILNNSTQHGSPKNRRKSRPAGTQNHPKMSKNIGIFRPKTPTGTKKAVFCRARFFMIFSAPYFRYFWLILGEFGAPRTKRCSSLFRLFLDIFRFFVRF